MRRAYSGEGELMSNFHKSDFAERLIVARIRAGYTMQSAAKLVGITPQAYMKYEHDKSMPNSSTLVAFCRAFDCSMEWLLHPTPLDFHSTELAPQGLHAKYWVRAAIAELKNQGLICSALSKD